jgi:type II secretory pathway pseudopilin PulG
MVEVMVATAVLAIATGVAMAYFVSASDTATAEVTRSVLEVNGTRIVSMIAESVTDGYVYDPDPSTGRTCLPPSGSSRWRRTPIR